jgi:pyruvate,water dikinase
VDHAVPSRDAAPLLTGLGDPVDPAETGWASARLSALMGAGFPVRPGFVVTASARERALRETGVDGELAHLYRRAVTGLLDGAWGDGDAGLAGACHRARSLVLRAVLPDRLAADVLTRWSAHPGDPATDLTSLSTCVVDGRDLPTARALVDGTGGARGPGVTAALVAGWGSVFAPSVVAARTDAGHTASPRVAVLVQHGARPAVTGTVTTADPVTGRPDRVVVVARAATVGSGVRRWVFDPTGRLEWPGDASPATTPPLPEHQLLSVVELGLHLQAHADAPQSVQWNLDPEGLWVTDARTVHPPRGSARPRAPHRPPGDPGRTPPCPAPSPEDPGLEVGTAAPVR